MFKFTNINEYLYSHSDKAKDSDYNQLPVYSNIKSKESYSCNGSRPNPDKKPEDAVEDSQISKIYSRTLRDEEGNPTSSTPNKNSQVVKFLYQILSHIITAEDPQKCISRCTILKYIAFIYQHSEILYLKSECNRAIRSLFPSTIIKRRGRNKAYYYHGIVFKPNSIESLMDSLSVEQGKRIREWLFLVEEDTYNTPNDILNIKSISAVEQESNAYNVYQAEEEKETEDSESLDDGNLEIDYSN